MTLDKFKAQKAKDFKNLPKSTLAIFDSTVYAVSTKFDGNQIFISKIGNSVRFFTSDWKEFRLPSIAKHLEDNVHDFTMMGEFMYDCKGKLGDRTKSAVLTTLRTCFNKDIPNPNTFDEDLVNIKIFDCIRDDSNKLVKWGYRILDARTINKPSQIEVIKFEMLTGALALTKGKILAQEGWEGVMLIDPNSTYEVGKRVNHAIKVKARRTADLLCIDVEQGQGKYEGMIGALVLQDSKGRVVKVGSGLTDADRARKDLFFIGKVIEIGYEQLLDTYIQPTFTCIRKDKDKTEID